MSRMRLVVLATLIVGGGGVLFILQRQGADTTVSPDTALEILGRAERSAERVPLTLTRVSDEEEGRIGETFAARFSGLAATDEGRARIAAYIDEVGQRVAAHAGRQAFGYQFHLQGEMVNAFALPGGQVVVGMGLLRLIESEDELAAILGHEVAHVDLRHCIERMQYELAARKIGLGGVYQLGDPFVDLFRTGYSAEQELDADRFGLELAVAAGYSPAGGPAAIERLAALRPAAEERQAATPIGELTDVARDALEGYFRSHPPEVERIAAMREITASEEWDAGQPTASVAPAVRAVLIVDEAGGHLQARRMTDAIPLYFQATRLAPDYRPGWRGAAEAFWLDGAEAVAATVALRALELDSADEELWHWLADAAPSAAPGGRGPRGAPGSGRGRRGTAGTGRGLGRTALLMALQARQPNLDEAGRRRLGVIQVGVPLFLEGFTLGSPFYAAYRASVNVVPPGTERARLNWLIGHMFYRSGQTAEATAAFYNAGQQWPAGQAAMAVDYAAALSDRNRQADAENVLRRASGLSRAQRARAEVIRAVIFERTDRSQEARAAFARAVDIDPLVLQDYWPRLHTSPHAAPVVEELRREYVAGSSGS